MPTTLRLSCLAALLLAATAPAAAPPGQEPARVGQIILVGNERTRDEVILRQVQLYPGQVLNDADLAAAERNLARLGIFVTRPRVTLLGTPASPYKDVMIEVQE